MPTTTHSRPVIVLLGPTAGGKTALSVALAQALPGGGECISADSMQVYRGMDIGTATPTSTEQEKVPHHLLDVVEPDQAWSVDDWLTAANAAIDDIRSRGRWPIVVGGTNLYVQALLFGLLDGPPPDAAVRAELDALDTDALRAELKQRDPDAAGRIHRNDRRRTIRAIEYARGTGRPLSDAQVQWTDACRNDVVIIGLDWPTETINGRINSRVSAMISDGLLEEVRALHANSRLGEQAAAAVGYAQVIDCLEGHCTEAEAIEQIKIRTRRFAKQQRTWLRRFRALPRLTWIDPTEESSQTLINKGVAAALAWGHQNPPEADDSCV
ncbi:MAG: tRNA (adenosine(37)-N6)-dimethylallyltransferase MiaA [Phycisphaerales bacterium]|nr:tRNA (adenosine(37)-N6)-dimethylallyltransferase MiaA [Phycisphaerales bacterium]